MWLLFTLLGIILCLILLLCIPLDLVFYCNTKTEPRADLCLQWLLGLIKYRLFPGRKKSQLKAETAPKQAKKFPFSFNTLFKMLRTGGLTTQVIRLLKGIFKCLRIKRLRARLSISLEDPVDYGYFFSICVPVNYLLARTPHDIRLEPLYDGQYIFDVDTAGAIRVLPIRLAGIALAFALSRPVMKIWGIMIRSRWK